jgi:hypothetical protein
MRFRHRRPHRRILAALMALCLTAIPVGAETAGTQRETSASHKDVGGGTAAGQYTGQIVPALIDVALPSSIDFEVFPSRPLEPGYTQAISPDIRVANNGVDIRLSVIGIEKQSDYVRGWGPDNIPGTGDDYTYDFTFVDSMAAMQSDGAPPAAALLSLRGDAPTSLSDFENRALTSQTVARDGGVLVALIPGGDQAALKVYCAVKSDYKVGGYSFSMVPTIKVEYDKTAK